MIKTVKCLYGVGLNEYQQLQNGHKKKVREPLWIESRLNFSINELKSVVILWSRIISFSNNSLSIFNEIEGRKIKSMDYCFNILSGCMNGNLTFNKRNKRLLIWDTTLNDQKVISCGHLDREKFSLEGIHMTEDGKTLFFITSDNLLYKSTTSFTEAKELLSIVIEPFHLKPSHSLTQKIKQVSCGKHHALILTGMGMVFGYGNGNQGQLGIGSIESREEPTIVEDLEGLFVTKISAGGWHSMALTDSGDIYVWGWNNYGQLGLPSGHSSVKTKSDKEVVNIQPFPEYLVVLESDEMDEKPCEKTHPEDENGLSFIDIASGSRHSLAISSEGGLFSWGWNKYGQLGYKGGEVSDCPKRVWLPMGDTATRIFAGHWNSVIEAHYEDHDGAEEDF